MASSSTNFGASLCCPDFLQLRGERSTNDRIVGSSDDESCVAEAIDENDKVTTLVRRLALRLARGVK